MNLNHIQISFRCKNNKIDMYTFLFLKFLSQLSPVKFTITQEKV